MNPYILLELAQIREQEAMQGSLMARAARQARRQARWARLRAWLGGHRASTPPATAGQALPPILRPEIRREAR
jgi:hypothetical protein